MKPKLVRPVDAERLVILGIPHLIHIRGTDTYGDLVFLETTIPAGVGIPPHVHTREDELFHVTRGEVEFLLDGRTVMAGPGTTVLGPRNIPHAYRAAGGEPASMTVTIRPSGIEAMFTALASLPAGPPDLARVAEICGAYGVRFA